MSDPYTHQGVGRMFPGSLGGRARVASSVTPVRRQKFVYPAEAVSSGWCLSTLYDFISDPDIGPNWAPFSNMGITDDGWMSLGFGGYRINLSDYSVDTNGPSHDLHQFGLGGVAGGVLYAARQSLDDWGVTPHTVDSWSGGAWVHVADLPTAWRAQRSTVGRDGNVYVIINRPAGSVGRLSAVQRWGTAGNIGGWTRGGDLTPTLTVRGGVFRDIVVTYSSTPATFTLTSPAVTAFFSETMTAQLFSNNSGGSAPTIQIQFLVNGSLVGSAVSATAGTTLNASASVSAGDSVQLVVTVVGPVTSASGALSIGAVFVGETIASGNVRSGVAMVTPGGTVTHLTALDDTVSNRYFAVTADSSGVVWVSIRNVDSGSPDYFVNTVLRRYDGSTVTDFGVWPLQDSSNDGSTEAWGAIFCDDEDHVLVPMIRYSGNPYLSWFLDVAPDGTATLIASSDDYSASTASNIADGPLPSSRACESDQGWGISLDGKTFYFVDNSDQSGGSRGNLLRKLARC